MLSDLSLDSDSFRRQEKLESKMSKVMQIL